MTTLPTRPLGDSTPRERLAHVRRQLAVAIMALDEVLARGDPPLVPLTLRVTLRHGRRQLDAVLRVLDAALEPNRTDG